MRNDDLKNPQLLPEELGSQQFTILRPADGKRGWDFIFAIRRLLDEDPTVDRAYLVVARIGEHPEEVLLLLRFDAGAANKDTLNRCARVFAKMFSSTETLGILPIDAMLEKRLTQIAPFFAK